MTNSKHDKEWLHALSTLDKTVNNLKAEQNNGHVINVGYTINTHDISREGKGIAVWKQIDLPGYKGNSDYIAAFISDDFEEPPISVGFDRKFVILEGAIVDPVTNIRYSEGDTIEVPAGKHFTTKGITDTVLIVKIIKK